MMHVTEDENANHNCITDDQLEALYARGCQLYRHGMCQEAENVFLYILIFQPTVKRYLKALGLVRMDRRKYAAALLPLTTAVLQDPDPTMMFLLGECLVKIGEKEKAIEILSKTEALAKAAGDVKTAKNAAAWLKICSMT
ncbi:tetratricopeptide repeat protein [Glaciimonas sp. GG7]